MATTTASPVLVRAPTGLPSPRSPTLSDFGMILPEADTSLRTASPSPYINRPPSPPALYTHSNRSERTIKLAPAPHDRVKSPPLSSQSSRSTLRTMADSDGSSNSKRSFRSSSRKNSPSHDDPLASSPTITDAQASHLQVDWSQQRRLSDASSSIHSEDLENLRWPGFDSSNHFDDSGVVLEEEDEEEEEKDKFNPDGDGDRPTDNGPWTAQTSDEYASAALSRRAELILANAKKRLNVMEGNLRGARESLVVSPTGSNYMQTDFQRQLATTRERDRKLYAGIGPIPPRIRPFHASKLSSDSTLSHSRRLSETSVPIPFMTPYTSRITPNKRASSAMGTASGPWSPEGFGQGRFPIRESRSFEVIREPRSSVWSNHHEERERPPRSQSRGSRSPPMVLETLPEHEDPYSIPRPSSSTSDLRSQMDSLKGRISSLKLRAQEDHLRRRSMQNLRTPSPFTSADAWYTEGDAYKSGTSMAADAGVGAATSSPVRKTLFQEQEDEEERVPSIRKKKSTEMSSNQRNLGLGKEGVHREHIPTNISKRGPQPSEREINPADDEDEEEDEDKPAAAEDYDQGGDSVYEDAAYELPPTERHEDRIDAFDYENFFLHSAMGTYSSTSRRSSTSSGSADSVATTRPLTVIDMRDSGNRLSMHQRNSSVDSVSTVESFETATEGNSDDDEDDEDEDEEDESEDMHDFSRRLQPVQNPGSQHYAMRDGVPSPRTDSAFHTHKPVSPSSSSPSYRESSPSPEMLHGLQTTKMYSILVEPVAGEEPRLALSEEEKQLIYGLAASFQHVAASLQGPGVRADERRELRRRLDEARRVLGGEEP